MNNINLKEILWKAHSQNLGDSFINYWAGMLNEVLDQVNSSTKIIEFGSTSSKFLRLVHLAFPYKESTGIILNADKNLNPNEWEKPFGTKCNFFYENDNNLNSNYYDLAFSSETFSLIPDLKTHSQQMWNLLGPKGVYYASFGWHKENPLIEKQSNIRKAKKQPFYEYDLDYVVKIFHESGFEVGFKKLPLPYFLIFAPELSFRRFGNIKNMISHFEEQVILFSFRKWEE